MDDLVNSLTTLGFTTTEARVYLVLVRDGAGTGYQVARSLGLARSSVYAALDGLFAAGAVYLKDGETSIYSAKEPGQLINERKKAYNENADALKTDLESLGDNPPSSSFYNLGSMEAILQKAGEILEGARNDVYINTDFDLEALEGFLHAAAERGIRIVMFSYRLYDIDDWPVEYYHRGRHRKPRGNGPVECIHHRLMISADEGVTMVAGGTGSDQNTYRGVFTSNSLMARIVAEHIHQDIYIQRDGGEFEKRIRNGELLLGTPHENRGE